MQDDNTQPKGCHFTRLRFTVNGSATICTLELVLTMRQLELFFEAIDTAHGALMGELDACSSNGDEEGASLRWADSCVLEQLQRLLAGPLGVMEGVHGDSDARRKAGTLDLDSAGAEAPSHDATSTSSAHTLASLADGADGDDPSGAVGALGGAQC